jgi:TPR repeat protein
MRMAKVIERIVLFLFMSLGLSGCIWSNETLLTREDAIEPLPASGSLVSLDPNGGIALDKNGDADNNPYQLEDGKYISKDINKHKSLMFTKIDDSNILLLQIAGLDDEINTSLYIIANIKDDTISIYLFSDLSNALKRAEAKFTETKLGQIYVNSKDQLILAAKVMAQQISKTDKVLRYRVVASDQQRAKLANDIKVAHLNWYGSKPDVQFTAGLAFEEGRGVSQIYPQGLKQDYAVAAEWYRKAANQGLDVAQFKLGWMYESGHGVPQDYAEAGSWYRKAADQGLAEAQRYLGDMYEKGRGTPQDYAEAAKWWRKAADQGNADAQFSLGAAYTLGRGVPEDYAEGVKWHRKAADQGDVYSQFALGTIYAAGPGGVPQNDSEAVRWLLKAAKGGHAKAQYLVGKMYAKGHNFQEAYAWLQVATEQGVSEAREGRDVVAAVLTPDALLSAQARATQYVRSYGKSASTAEQRIAPPPSGGPSLDERNQTIPQLPFDVTEAMAHEKALPKDVKERLQQGLPGGGFGIVDYLKRVEEYYAEHNQTPAPAPTPTPAPRFRPYGD